MDPTYGTRMGDYFANYLAEEAKALGMSVEQVMAWVPPEKAKKARRKHVYMRIAYRCLDRIIKEHA